MIRQVVCDASAVVYDASYVAAAEILGVPLITLDRRLGRAPGPRCVISIPRIDL